MDLKSQEMSQLRESFGAACLVCTSPLAEPFQDSEILINRNVSLLEAFCEYMDVQGDCEVVAKEFPFCGLCKITLVELKALHTEVQAMFTRIFSIKLKLTAEIMESQNTHMNKGTDFCNPRSVRFTNDRGIHFEFGSQPEISTLENIKFSKSVYKCVTAWRNSIFRRFDVAVTVIPPKKQLSGASVSPYEGAVIEPECSDSQLANCGDGMDNYSGNEVSDLEGETEEIKENLDRELTPPIDDSDIAPPIVTAGSREMESIITSTEHEIDLLTLTTKRKSDNFIAVSHSEVSKQLNHGEDLSRDHVSVCDDTELTDKDYSEDSVPDSDSDDWAEPKKLRRFYMEIGATKKDCDGL
ncbi:unnamed protein product [Allacma fusca]|uniref:Uncharacterized protein n=1 Tax=Allacma fusca TaxID=39272 RepID=A0A8J2P8Z7_9HEXA|nr:unnamed protein product [Allacma fusca]